MLSRSQVLAQFWSAVRVALRDLPDGAAGVRVYGGHESATVCVTGDGGDLVVCTVRQRTAPAGDGRQLTIDDALASQASRKTVIVSAPAAVPVEEPAAVPVEAQPEEPAKAPPYALLRVSRSNWLRHRRALGDVVGGAHRGDWVAVGDHRTCFVTPEQLDAILFALGDFAYAVCAEACADNFLLHRHEEHAACDDRMRTGYLEGLALVWAERDDGACHAIRLGAGDWRSVVHDHQAPNAIARVYRDGVCLWDSRDGGAL